MAIPCNACRRPVHPQVVVCPHCGEPTGVVADTTLTAEEAVAAVELERIKSDTYVVPPILTGSDHGYGYEPELALIGGAAVAALAVGAVVKSAVEAVVEDRRAGPELPLAIARERTPSPVVPATSKEPEPAPPPASQPRFLK